MPAGKAGDFVIPQTGFNCANPQTGPVPTKVSCNIGSDGVATAAFKTTMQPGDNFAVAVSLDDAYRNDIKVDPAAGSNLINSSSQTISVSGASNGGRSSVPGIRTDMLTVWRKLHIEVDSMGNVGSGDNITGTVTTVGQTACARPPTSCVVNTGFFVNTTPALETERFNNGRISVNGTSFSVLTNDGTSVTLNGSPQGSTTVPPGSTFTLYDDDDYNADDGGSPDGDSNEPIVRLPDSFKYLSAEDGNYPDGKPKNLYASAYIMPEYNWAENVAHYNQTNLQFELNVEDGTNNATLINVLNRNRDSKNDERDEFWIGYILIGYQGPLLADFDGLNPNGTANENARLGVGPSQFTIGAEIPTCDCYNSSVCPSGGVSCALPNGTQTIPRGALDSLIFQEVQQDVKKYFIAPPSPVAPRTVEDIKLTIPHELGHQFGVLGDQVRSTFKIMDYSNYVGNVVNDEAFHPEHINIMRRRVKSPGN